MGNRKAPTHPPSEGGSRQVKPMPPPAPPAKFSERAPGRIYYGVQRGARMPCLYGSKQDAIEGRDVDERVVKLRVEVLEVL